MTKLKNHLKSCLPFFLYIYSPLCFLALGKVYPLWQAVIWELPVTWERHSQAPQPCWLCRTTDYLSPAPLPAPSLVPGTGTRELHTKRTFFLSYYHLPELSIKKMLYFCTLWMSSALFAHFVLAGFWHTLPMSRLRSGAAGIKALEDVVIVSNWISKGHCSCCPFMSVQVRQLYPSPNL